MPKEKKKFEKRLYPYICILGISITIVFLAVSSAAGEKQKKSETYHMLELYGVRTEALLNSLFHKTDILESVIITQQGALDQNTFENLARALMEGKGIRAVQCLPDGIVTYCYPVEGNEKTIGGNIFEQKDRREDALLALETKQIALSGPYNLTQGGFGLVARNPIFITGEDGVEKFWGFAVVIMDLPEALEPLMLAELQTDGYEYQISCEVNEKKVIVDQSPVIHGPDNKGGKEKDPFSDESGGQYVEVKIHVPNHEWLLKVAPRHGWINKKRLLFQGLTGLLVTFLGTVIFYLMEQQGRQMEENATTDELTGLFNRRRLKEYMDIRCRDETIRFAMFYIDLNRFKAINDTISHACGDAVLKESGQRIKKALGKEGSVYRIGGDEFIAVMEVDVNKNTCEITKNRIKAEIAKPLIFEKHHLCISASIGFVLFPTEGKTLDELMNLADERMYLEKDCR